MKYTKRGGTLSSFDLSCSLCGIIPIVDNKYQTVLYRPRSDATYRICFEVCVLLDVLGVAAVKVVWLLGIATPAECASVMSTVRDGSINYYYNYYYYYSKAVV